MELKGGVCEGRWHAMLARVGELCCSYESRVLLASVGNVDWRPVLNLWVVAEYVTKYAMKAYWGDQFNERCFLAVRR